MPLEAVAVINALQFAIQTHDNESFSIQNLLDSMEKVEMQSNIVKGVWINFNQQCSHIMHNSSLSKPSMHRRIKFATFPTRASHSLSIFSSDWGKKERRKKTGRKNLFFTSCKCENFPSKLELSKPSAIAMQKCAVLLLHFSLCFLPDGKFLCSFSAFPRKQIFLDKFTPGIAFERSRHAEDYNESN